MAYKSTNKGRRAALLRGPPDPKKAEGVLRKCKSCPELTEKSLCSECRRRHSECQSNRFREKRAAGICTRCSAIAAVGSFCLEHWFRNAAMTHTGTRANGPLLQKIWEEQRGKCPYTGVDLVPGVNATLDHKTPLLRGGSAQRENLQWVLSLINRMKTDMTHEEFLATCLLVLSRAGGGT